MIDARSFVLGAALRLAVGAGAALALAPVGAAPAQRRSTAAAAAQTTFPSPEAAAEALVDALGNAERRPFRALFGARVDELRGSADAVEWREDRLELHRAAQESLTVRKDADDRAVLVLGLKAWPFPFPLVAENGAWR